MLPVALLPDCGAKTALKVTLAPGFKTSGKLSPLMLKPVPETVAPERVTLDPPVFVSASVRVALAPTCTLPNDRLDGLPMSCPAAAALPDSGMFNVEFEALEAIAKFPLTLPADCGAKTTESV